MGRCKQIACVMSPFSEEAVQAACLGFMVCGGSSYAKGGQLFSQTVQPWTLVSWLQIIVIYWLCTTLVPPACFSLLWNSIVTELQPFFP